MSSTLVQSSIGSSVSTSTSAGCWNFSPSTKSPSPVPSSSSSPSSSPSPLSPEQEEEVSPLPPMSTTHHHQLNSNNNNNNSHRRDEHGFYSMESTTISRSDENNLVPKAELRDLLHSDNGSVLISVYYFIKNFIGGGQTAGSGVTIDTKIEEALDLVKSNLMFAVREEVDTLKEQIDVLMNKVHRLEFENRILRAHASSEALAMLDRAERRSLPNLSRSRSAGQSLSVFVNESNNNDYNADGSSVTD